MECKNGISTKSAAKQKKWKKEEGRICATD